MFLAKHRETYWNSYRLLEDQFLRLSHSICFDDDQVNVYSSELADIINSACIKIESLSKDIYEEHIWPFQMDDGIVPKSLGKKKFDPDKWNRDKWKFDHHCLIEIDNKFALSKKRIELKTERFLFRKYGSTILPFATISQKENRGGYWEYSEQGPWRLGDHRVQNVGWLESYQSIKHNYIQSITEHGTIKNAIMALAAFYLLAVYYSCLPSRQFDVEDKSEKFRLTFGSELFFCGMCNYTVPPCIVDSSRINREADPAKEKAPLAYQELLKEQELLNDIDGYPFLITLNSSTYTTVNRMVDAFCTSRGLDRFDVALYQSKSGGGSSEIDAGDLLYQNIKAYIRAPYQRRYVSITFNTGVENIYDNLLIDGFDYEKSKYAKQTAATLAVLQVGDVVDARVIFDDDVTHAEVVKLTEYSVDLSVQVGDHTCITSHPKGNIIYIRKSR